ncbi:DUF6317 family protein [Mycobacterium sp. MUNTM1]
MTDFKAVIDDLTALATRYATEAPIYEGVAEKLKVAPPDSGDGALNESMQTLIDELGTLNSKMAASLLQNADKIKDCRDRYQIADDSDKNRFLWDNMTSGIQ